MKLHLTPAPHVHSPQTTRALMRNVLLALAPCAVAGVVIFGAPALVLMAVSVLSAVAGEACWQRLTGQKVRVNDLSAAVTGLILGMNLSPRAPWWLAVVGGLFAVVLVKGLFGGLGDNFLNPALAARAFFAEQRLGQLFLGNIPGSIGEVCKAAVLVGFIILLCTRTITWHIPVSLTLSTLVFCGLLGYNPIAAVLSGGVLFASVFMATDYVTCPMSAKGQLIYGVGAGLLIALIRKFGLYPEGVTFAILLMNVATPLIDRYTKRRVYGYEKEAKA